MALERLREKRSPFPFASRKEAGQSVPKLYEESLSLGHQELGKLQEINSLLQNPNIDRFIEEKKLTLGIIKPNAYMGRGLPQDDDGAASVLFSEIGKEHIVFDFSTQLTPKQIESFYADVREKYFNVYPEGGAGETIWQTVYKLLNSGPVTFLLLYRKEADAVSWWRKRMGNTHPANADPDSIRGKYGIEENMPNNLTHGSDSVDGAKREISVLKNIVSELAERCQRLSAKFPDEVSLRNLGVLHFNQNLISIERIYDSGMRSESWIYAYRLNYQEADGTRQTKLIKEKNIISFGGLLEQRARNHVRKQQSLENIGIRTPRTYGVNRAAIYMDFIECDKTEEVLNQLKSSLTMKTRQTLNQLIEIAARLDNAGYQTLNFIGDLIYDGKSEEFFYVDTGFDLGERTTESVTAAYKTLVATFRNYSDYIGPRYSEIRQSLQNRKTIKR